jgi:hypothetical protein
LRAASIACTPTECHGGLGALTLGTVCFFQSVNDVQLPLLGHATHSCSCQRVRHVQLAQHGVALRITAQHSTVLPNPTQYSLHSTVLPYTILSAQPQKVGVSLVTITHFLGSRAVSEQAVSLSPASFRCPSLARHKPPPPQAPAASTPMPSPRYMLYHTTNPHPKVCVQLC